MVNTCSFAGLGPGVRRSTVSFVFSFKILILAKQLGCVVVELPLKSHSRAKKKKKSHGGIENDSFVKLQETFPYTAQDLQPVTEFL